MALRDHAKTGDIGVTHRGAQSIVLIGLLMQTGGDQDFLADPVDHGIRLIQSPRGLVITDNFRLLAQGAKAPRHRNADNAKTDIGAIPKVRVTPGRPATSKEVKHAIAPWKWAPGFGSDREVRSVEISLSAHCPAAFTDPQISPHRSPTELR